jgi:hypothetical protein
MPAATPAAVVGVPAAVAVQPGATLAHAGAPAPRQAAPRSGLATHGADIDRLCVKTNAARAATKVPLQLLVAAEEWQRQEAAAGGALHASIWRCCRWRTARPAHVARHREVAWRLVCAADLAFHPTADEAAHASNAAPGSALGELDARKQVNMHVATAAAARQGFFGLAGVASVRVPVRAAAGAARIVVRHNRAARQICLADTALDLPSRAARDAAAAATHIRWFSQLVG